MALFKAQFYEAGDEFGGLGQVVLDQRVGDAEGVIALLEGVVGAFQVGQGLVMVGVVVSSIDLDIEAGVGDGDIDGLVAVAFFEFGPDALFSEQEIQGEGVAGGGIPLVLQLFLAGDAEEEVEMIDRILGYAIVDGSLAVAAGPVGGKVFHWMGGWDFYNVKPAAIIFTD
jgi:hypothetical protein